MLWHATHPFFVTRPTPKKNMRLTILLLCDLHPPKSAGDLHPKQKVDAAYAKNQKAQGLHPYLSAQGRRSADDERQIARWANVCGPTGRWKQNLIAKCLRDDKPFDDETVAPVVRQTLQHWAYQLTEEDFTRGAERVRLQGAAYVPRAELGHVIVPERKTAAKKVSKGGQLLGTAALLKPESPKAVKEEGESA